MPDLQPSDFEQFFYEVHGRIPFPWQTRLAHQVCEQGWPKVIDLPPASGKTACIDIALFALALLKNQAPRRIFFVVDRRVIVSEAVARAERIKKKLEESGGGVLKLVAEELRRLSGDAERPLITRELRGGAFRDETWVRMPRQPVVIASTVDQIGSRLLFRGYGVSPKTWPIHAGLIANDALIILDEAHCSKPFAKTLQVVEGYRAALYSTSPLDKPFASVEMTATPALETEASERFTIDAEDRENEVFARRLYAAKPTRLRAPIKCRKDEIAKFAAALVEEAKSFAAGEDVTRVAILANRIATAKEVHRLLCNDKQDALLVIGRMRPLDRDWLADQWKPLKSGEPRDGIRRFIVSTQCLEVGADLDFDVLVTECADIDALQQRFGRLNRLGDFPAAQGAILVGSWQLGPNGDPVYGDALRRTWDFLDLIATGCTVNMGVESAEGAPSTVTEHVRALPEAERLAMRREPEAYPALLPAHIDTLAQTNPQPEPQLLIELFLHGKGKGSPDVYVVWRRDLNGADARDWPDIVVLCPPSSLEAMPVPLWAFRKWLASETFRDESDLEIATKMEEEESDDSTRTPVLLWAGPDDAKVTRNPRSVYPGATVVLPESAGGWDDLGSKPPLCEVDRGDEARMALRRRLCMRLHPDLIELWPESPERDALLPLISNPDSEPHDIWDIVSNFPETSRPARLKNMWPYLREDGLSVYPDGHGWIVEGYWGEETKAARKRVSLHDHLESMKAAVERIVGDLLPPNLKQALITAAHYHDYGKADMRYQAWLRNGDLLAAQYAPAPIAKSGRTVLRKMSECDLPGNFRHELLSYLFAAKATDIAVEHRDLVLHLVASHHG